MEFEILIIDDKLADAQAVAEIISELADVKTTTFDNPEEDNLLFAFDYHLEGRNTGLSLVNEFGLASESVLVTSAYMEQAIINEAQRFNVSVYPKSLI